MTLFRRVCCGLVIAALLSALPARAATAATAEISGTVSDAQGGAIAGATVSLDGPAHAKTQTDEHGSYDFKSSPGLYALTVEHAGYQTATLSNVVLITGTHILLNASLVAISLSSLQEIGHVVAHAGGAVLNTSAAAENIISGQVFTDQSQSQVGPILDEIPGIVASYDGSGENAASPGAQTYAQIRGSTRNETATLLDGHPLAVINGGYLLQTLNGAMFQDIELIKGPGATAPSISNAIGGTVNFVTLNPTPTRQSFISWGADTYGGEQFGFRTTGTLDNGRFGYALAYAANGTPGAEGTMEVPWQPAYGTVYIGNNLITSATYSENTSNKAYQNGMLLGSTNLVACCAQVSDSFIDRAQLLKLRYKLSNATTATVSYVGFQSFQDFNGAHLAQADPVFCSTGCTGYDGSLPANQSTPVYQGLANVGEYAYDFEPVFEAELSTTIHGDSLLARYYGAGFSRPAYNTINSPVGSYTSTYTLYGAATVQTPNGTTQNLTFNGVPERVTEVAQGCDYTANACVSPAQYQQVEQDRMGGASVEYDHYANNDADTVYTFSTDFNRATGYSSRLDRIIAPSQPWGTGQSDLAIMGRIATDLTPKLHMVWSNYFDAYNTIFSNDGGLTWNDQAVEHLDSRLGLEYRAKQNISYRFALGSALSPPNLGELGTTGHSVSYTNGETYATEVIPNAVLRPESSFGVDLGASYLLGARRNTVLDIDFYRTNLFGQLIEGSYDTGQFYQVSANETVPIYDTEYVNLSRARYQGAEMSLRSDPSIGMGYTANLALIRGYPFDIPASLYGPPGSPGNLAIVPNVNYQPEGDGSGGAIGGVTSGGLPYSTGYAEIHYRTPHHDLFSVGATYLGPNNSYNRPAFFIARATARFSLDRQGSTYIQIAGYNLFNVYADPYYLQDQGIPEALAPYNVNEGTIADPNWVPVRQLGYTNANSVGPARYTFTITRLF